jgi:hypothetical protein
MKFYDIDDYTKVVPGEYLLHVPSKSIVLCGAFDGGSVRVMGDGRLFEDDIGNFKKIAIDKKERKHYYVATCKSCGG